MLELLRLTQLSVEQLGLVWIMHGSAEGLIQVRAKACRGTKGSTGIAGWGPLCALRCDLCLR